MRCLSLTFALAALAAAVAAQGGNSFNNPPGGAHGPTPNLTRHPC